MLPYSHLQERRALGCLSPTLACTKNVCLPVLAVMTKAPSALNSASDSELFSPNRIRSCPAEARPEMSLPVVRRLRQPVSLRVFVIFVNFAVLA